MSDKAWGDLKKMYCKVCDEATIIDSEPTYCPNCGTDYPLEDHTEWINENMGKP